MTLNEGDVMRLTRDARHLLIGVPATRNNWIWDLLSDELIEDIDKYDSFFQIENYEYVMLSVDGTKRPCWPPHSPNNMVARTCKLPRYSYRKVVCIRNPWERYVSLYDYFRNNPSHAMYNACNEWEFKEFIANVIKGNATFDTQPAAYFMLDQNGDLDYDRIFRFENPQEIADYFRGQGYRLRGIDILSKNREWLFHYDQQTIDRVSAYSRFDIEHFGYEPPQLSATNTHCEVEEAA